MASKAHRQSAPGNQAVTASDFSSTNSTSSSVSNRRGRPAKGKTGRNSSSNQSAALSLCPSSKDTESESSSIRDFDDGSTQVGQQLTEQGSAKAGLISSKESSRIKLRLRFGPLDEVPEESEAVGKVLLKESSPSFRSRLSERVSEFLSHSVRPAQSQISSPNSVIGSQLSSAHKAALSQPKRSSLVKAGSPPKPRTPVRFTSPVVSAEYAILPDEVIGRLVTPASDKSESESFEFGYSSTPSVGTGHTTQGSQSKETAQESRRQKKSKKKKEPASMSSAQTPSSAVQALQAQQRYPTYDSFTSIPPQLFDIVPRTERLLSRILVPDQGIGAAAILDHEGSVPEHKRPLDIKDLDSAANGVMVQIQRARAAVTGLPGVDRTVEEQEEEIEWLESRVEKQKAMLKTLRDLMAATSAKDEK